MAQQAGNTEAFTFKNWREFWSDASFSLEQINVSHYLSKEHNYPSPQDQSMGNESVRLFDQEKECAIENGKRVKGMKLDKLTLDAEAKMKQSSSSNSSRSSISNAKRYKDNNRISLQYHTPYKSISPRLQQHQPKPTLKETIAILRTIFPRDPRGRKEREPELKWPKQQQYVGLMNVVEKFHEIMKQIIEKEKKKPKVTLLRQYTEHPNKDNLALFYPLKNYRLTPILRPKELNLTEQQWNQFLEYEREGIVPFVVDQSTTSRLGGISKKDNISQDYQISVMESWILQHTPPNRIVADGTYDNGDGNKTENAFESKNFTNNNNGLRKNDSGTQLQATVNGEANPEINITKTSANTPPHNVSGSDGLGENGCGTQLQAATNENGHENHHAINSTGNENNNQHSSDNRIGGQQQNNEIQHEQVSGNNKPGELRSSYTTHSEYELRNLNTSQPKGQPPLITILPELGQVKGKVIIPKQKIQQANEHDPRSKTVGAEKQGKCSPVFEDMTVKRHKGNRTSEGPKKQIQGSNSEFKIEIESDFQTDQPQQLNRIGKNGGKWGGQRSLKP
ncbi:MAG: hypothetical protein EZS28_021502 [Streblomastix strix]|uniref:Uncharacterized protein n=1 Tax=Streblomastix strix TaxID=222440 RepID=A0A5J4VK68_9EUKA|nr:MAG: hypothetical protein EZS28_021502 [Streblomastix strix]